MAGTGTATRPTQSRDHGARESKRVAPAATEAVEKDKKPTWEETKAIFERAEGGDAKALELWKKNPDYQTLATVFTLGSITESKLAKKTFGENCLVSMSYVEKELEEMRQSLRGLTPSPLESVLVEEVVLCYFMLRRSQLHLADFTRGDIDDLKLREVRLDKAQNRFLAATRTLAQVRRLQIPTLVQLNVANQQVNVA